jgi:hypothetical protein
MGSITTQSTDSKPQVVVRKIKFFQHVIIVAFESDDAVKFGVLTNLIFAISEVSLSRPKR